MVFDEWFVDIRNMRRVNAFPFFAERDSEAFAMRQDGGTRGAAGPRGSRGDQEARKLGGPTERMMSATGSVEEGARGTRGAQYSPAIAQ